VGSACGRDSGTGSLGDAFGGFDLDAAACVGETIGADVPSIHQVVHLSLDAATWVTAGIDTAAIDQGAGVDLNGIPRNVAFIHNVSVAADQTQTAIRSSFHRNRMVQVAAREQGRQVG